jgi:hypothetical protein
MAIGFADTHLVRAFRSRIIMAVLGLITGNIHPVPIAACAAAEPDERERHQTKQSRPRLDSLSTKRNHPLSHPHCILQHRIDAAVTARREPP